MLPIPSGVVASVLPAVLQSDEGDGFIVVVIGFLLGLYLVYYGFGLWRRKRLIQDTPTETVQSIAVGRTELEGTARPAAGVASAPDGTFDAPFTDEECLHVDWQVEEYRKDPDDDNDKSWDTIASGSRTEPFRLDDGTGEVLVRADDHDPTFEISDEFTTQHTVGGLNSPPDQVAEFINATHHQAMGPEPAAAEPDPKSDEDDEGFLASAVDTVTDALDGSSRIGTSSNKRRYTQEIVSPNADVYVFGGAYPRDVEEAGVSNASKLALERDDATDIFLVSDLEEDALTKYYSWKGPVSTVGGLALSAITLYLILSTYLGM